MIIRKLSLLLMLLVLAGGCKNLKYKLGFGSVENPDPGTPEELIQKIFKAGLNPDKEAGWLQLKPLIHSSELKSIVNVKDWKRLRFRRLRKQVKLYVNDTSKVSFKIMRVKEWPDGTLEYFVHNSKSDMPTPCTFKKDPANGGAWRIWTRCSY